MYHWIICFGGDLDEDGDSLTVERNTIDEALEWANYYKGTHLIVSITRLEE